MIVPVPPTVSVSAPVRALLAGAVDYAGLFPPASLELTRAIGEYLSIRATDERWVLGRFVIPVAALGELARSLHQGRFLPEGPPPIPLAAVIGAGLLDDIRIIERFNRECAGAVVVEAVEVKAPTPDGVRHTLAALPSRWIRYLEVPPGAGLPEMLDALKEGEAFAKLRTGGVTPDAFPSPDAVVDFLEGCARRRLPFKATAGLHHPVRGEYRLTYAPDAETAPMYGYLNLIGAAALLWTGQSRAEAREVLLASRPGSFRFETGGLRILGRLVSVDTLGQVRAEFVHGFGSCSFREPLDELAPLAAT
jgi:hypothetical protein